jgi:hypothetical protein
MPPEPYLEHINFYVTYECAQLARGNVTLGLKGLPGPNTLSYRAHLYITKEMKCCEYITLFFHTWALVTVTIRHLMKNL